MSDKFVWSLKNGDLEQVQEYVYQNKIDVNKNIEGRTPLHYAADYGQKEIIRYLIDKGANVNVVDKHGISPLLAAIWEGHTDCIKYMIEKGADVTGKTPDGLTYLDAAEKQEIKKLLQ
ncbi:myotrophin-like protein [Leptotrombidium deliense]|uniref:Myotrophin-like protein n=1 Tax=Leptotrombidium deliense TaxID=299467 RepID=A0A443SRU1_9ACAR|nr:myotrophin-like protein [Leptotrombidium deliense]